MKKITKATLWILCALNYISYLFMATFGRETRYTEINKMIFKGQMVSVGWTICISGIISIIGIVMLLKSIKKEFHKVWSIVLIILFIISLAINVYILWFYFSYASHLYS